MDKIRSLSEKEIFSYGIGNFGQNMIYNFMASFLLFFYTDVFGIGAAAAGTILLVARVWDAVNDPMMGMLVDRTHTKWGKFRPYLAFTPILFVPFAVLTFSAPSLSPAKKIAWAAFTYISFGMIYTASDVPFWAMASSITTNEKDRNRIVTAPRLSATVAVALATVITKPLLDAFGKTNMVHGYQSVALLYSLLTVVCFLVTFFGVKERAKSNPRQIRPNFRDIFSTIFGNKPLLLVILSGLFTGIGQTAKLSMLIYYVTYNLMDGSLYTLFAGINIPFILIGISLVPFFSRRFGKKRTCIGYYLVYALGSLGFYLVGWRNIPVLLAFNCIASLGMASPQVVQTAMIADTIEYGEYTTGNRNEGIIFSTQTFLAKLTQAITSVLIAWSLAALHFVPNAVQTETVKQGLHALISFIPFFSSLIGILPIIFYPLGETEHARIVEELEKRR
jgi:GPH family glycoside/pentoside/hexuronide:cation symporter/probable glucitol transport protein GutA